MHLVIDGFGADESKLQDLALVFDLLDNFPGAIGMTKIMPPYVFRYTGVKPEDWGVSGVVLIAESHISIHTFPDKNYINIDVFSCKAFDAELAVQFMKDNKADTVKFGKKITGYDDDIQSEEYDDVMPMMSVSMKFDPESTDVVSESLIDLEIAKTKLDLTKYYTERFLPTVR